MIKTREEIELENKSVQAMPPIHEAQSLLYPKLSGHRLGFLVNWNVALDQGRHEADGQWVMSGFPTFLALRVFAVNPLLHTDRVD